ncbi:MAG: UDP-2,3-diacylglucosamine diphosphatase [Tannerella sp.]|jgi:UDP-2,3-diacylglucosamine hydrolase|nr:UDP-2,3-diacylglucosamine diphosphatase [Tannerella sp.]
MTTTAKKVYFASDAHLGNRFLPDVVESEKKLVRWLDSISADAQAVYFLGDMFDYWYEYKYVVPKGFVRFLGKVAEMADQGIEIHFLTGNHDIWMFDYLEKEIGAAVHRKPFTVSLSGKQFFLAHGDEVGKRPLTYRIISALFRNKLCQWLYASVHPRWTFAFARLWSYHSRKTGQIREMQADDSDYLFDFVQKNAMQGVDYFIFGHRHVLFDYELPSRVKVIVTGDWMQLFSYVEWDGADLTLKRFEE